LSQFIRPGSSLESFKIQENECDEYGRSLTYGSRKTAKAQVWMLPGQGHIKVNGLHFSDYFDTRQELLNVIKGLEVTSSFGQFNIWAIVGGSGKTSQSQALSVALCRGLVIHQPLLKNILNQHQLLTIDTRQVERKKTGQPKARKKITWVKR
jgi:small subunit ribosomal protein S9